MREYVKKDGTVSKYEYRKEYNQKRNKTIQKLQTQKSYYKRTGNLEKVKACQILIDIEKRKIEMGE